MIFVGFTDSYHWGEYYAKKSGCIKVELCSQLQPFYKNLRDVSFSVIDIVNCPVFYIMAFVTCMHTAVHIQGIG